MITEYEVGQIPGDALPISVRDNSDTPVNLSIYSSLELEILGSNNETLDLDGVTLHTQGARNGILAVIWPKDRSLFTEHGDYLLRIALHGSDGSRDYTRPHTIRVRGFGRVNN